MTVSFHLVRMRLSQVPTTARRTLTDRRALGRVPGLRFARTFGTGSGSRMTRGADLRRWAMLAVWDSEQDLERFAATSLALEHRRGVEEAWRGTFELIGAHGSWRGRDPFAGLEHHGTTEGPVAVLTRATVPLRKWREFTAAVPAVDAQLHEQAGLLATVGIGERPIGLQATFSLWRDAEAVRKFAYEGAHAEVIKATRANGWFREECFARFAPTGSWGTWDGSDPLDPAFVPTTE